MGQWKLIENVATGEIKVFDTKNDSNERNNLFDNASNRWEQLFKSYKNLLSKHSVKPDEKLEKKLEMDVETREQLKALGYL